MGCEGASGISLTLGGVLRMGALDVPDTKSRKRCKSSPASRAELSGGSSGGILSVVAQGCCRMVGSVWLSVVS